MKRGILAVIIIVVILFISVLVYISLSYEKVEVTKSNSSLIYKSINPEFRCETDSDCVLKQYSCKFGACWNKDNTPSPPDPLTFNAGACAPIPDVTGCVCEQNRCQPLPDERNRNTFNLQSCETNENCYSDEICFSSMGSFDGEKYTINHDEEGNKVCHPICNTNDDCPIYMKCNEAELGFPFSKKDSELVKFCDIRMN